LGDRKDEEKDRTGRVGGKGKMKMRSWMRGGLEEDLQD
jgi:hypothetical protein